MLTSRSASCTTAGARDRHGQKRFWLVFVLCCVGLFACGRRPVSRQSPPEGPVTLTIGYTQIIGQDPLYGLPQVARLISLEGLVSTGEDGKPQPRLAETWTESPDGLNWTIKLRPNAEFHDGSPVDSAAVKSSLERSLMSSNRDLTPGLSDIVAIETPSPHTVTIHLRDRSTFLLDDLTTPIVKAEAGSNQIGTGPYFIASTSGNGLVMQAVTRYYRGAPTIQRIILRAYPTVRTAWAAMMREEMDFLYEVAPDTLEFISNEASVQVFPFLRNYVYGVVFNSRQPIFRDRRVRQALNYAVDRAAVLEQVFKGHGYAANGPAWPKHWAFDPDIPNYIYDPARAVALLDSVNLPKEQGPNARRGPARLHFTCIVPENFALWERMALLVQRNLFEIGIDMDLQAVPAGNEFNRRAISGEFDAVFTELIAGRAASRQPMFWYSTSGQNFSGYRSSTVDASLDGIRKATGEGDYRNAFRRFQMEMLDDPPAIFLALGENTRAVSRRFQVLSPPNTDILYTIANWGVDNGTLRAAN